MTNTLFTATRTAVAVASVIVLSACAGGSGMMANSYSQASLPESVKVPAGHKVAWETVGTGEITYECKAKADMPGSFAWVFVGPKADLMSRTGAKVGTYFGPPATWAANDGSSITGTQLAVAPSGAANIPLQLVKANPANGSGAMTGVTYIQRVDTRAGIAPATTCDASSAGRKEIVKYQADYIFYKAV